MQLTTKLVHNVDFFIDTDTRIIEAGELSLQTNVNIGKNLHMVPTTLLKSISMIFSMTFPDQINPFP